jgi:hypothetical protein
MVFMFCSCGGLDQTCPISQFIHCQGTAAYIDFCHMLLDDCGNAFPRGCDVFASVP